MLISAAALAVPWRQSHCNTAPMCPWVLHVPLSQGVNGWLWLPLIYIKAPPILCLWRDDMSLCTLVILLISYGPSLLIPSCYSEFSLCSSLPFVPLIFFQLLYVWLFYPHFFQWFLFSAMWMSLFILLLGVFFISCGSGQSSSVELSGCFGCASSYTKIINSVFPDSWKEDYGSRVCIRMVHWCSHNSSIWLGKCSWEQTAAWWAWGTRQLDPRKGVEPRGSDMCFAPRLQSPCSCFEHRHSASAESEFSL